MTDFLTGPESANTLRLMHFRRGPLLRSVLVLTLIAVPLAHHSVPGQFDMSKSLTLNGTISKVDWINPHPYVYLDVKGVDGKVTAWALSTLPIPMLRKAGLTKETLFGKARGARDDRCEPGTERKKAGVDCENDLL